MMIVFPGLLQLVNLLLCICNYLNGYWHLSFWHELQSAIYYRMLHRYLQRISFHGPLSVIKWMIYVKITQRCFSKAASSRENKQIRYTRAVLHQIVKQVSWFHVKLAVTSNSPSARLIFQLSLEKKQPHSEEKTASIR